MIKTVKIPKILLPNSGIDMSKWSVIACDQFTSQPEYWQKVKDFVGDSPSALNIIFPEAYLEEADKGGRIKAINDSMRGYLDNGIFREFEGFVLVERTMSDGQKRLGLVVAIDLEDYEYTPKNDALIKATERTVVERLPARIEVRKGACIESPHVMMLMDDTERKIIESLYAERDKLELLYDFTLNMGGGSVKGYKVEDCKSVIDGLATLLDRDTLIEKYGSEKPILFAVGDGNHSLATAKECWNNLKSSLKGDELDGHPSRYALCELVNLHDESLQFQPIHRAVFGVGEEFIEYMGARLAKGEGRVRVIFKGKTYYWSVSSNASDAIADIQQLIDEYRAERKQMTVDYIHGDGHLESVAKEKNAAAIFMPCLEKDGLFDYVVRRGVLPRKSFSLGHAEDKRYYLECRQISGRR